MFDANTGSRQLRFGDDYSSIRDPEGKRIYLETRPSYIIYNIQRTPGKKNFVTAPVAMPNRILKIIMNGVTGRMGRTQHLARSIVAIRQQGGLQLRNGETLWPEPILVGRNERRLRSLAEEHGLTLWTTDLQEALSDPDAEIYFDTQVTSERASAVKAAIAAGKHIYCEKPIADDLRTAKELAELASSAGVKNGVVQDKLFLPGLRKLKALVENGFLWPDPLGSRRVWLLGF